MRAAPRRPRAAQHRRDPGAQLRVGERLLYDVVRAAVEQPDALQAVGVAAERDHRRVGIGAAGEPFAGAKRVDQRKRVAVDVDEHQVGLRGREQGASALA